MVCLAVVHASLYLISRHCAIWRLTAAGVIYWSLSPGKHIDGDCKNDKNYSICHYDLEKYLHLKLGITNLKEPIILFFIEGFWYCRVFYYEINYKGA
jgi:hypothetical protein